MKGNHEGNLIRLKTILGCTGPRCNICVPSYFSCQQSKRMPIIGLSSTFSLSTRLPGWGGSIRNLDMANWKSDALACPRGAAEPLFAELHKSLETFGFREPYRIGGVQSSGE